MAFSPVHLLLVEASELSIISEGLMVRTTRPFLPHHGQLRRAEAPNVAVQSCTIYVMMNGIDPCIRKFVKSSKVNGSEPRGRR